MIDVSIIIVNWNTRKLLLECIDSIIEQTTEVTYEIIVVDNASSDDSVLSLKERFHQVRIIENKENLGFSKANNQGIALSTGRNICLVNSDVVILENSIDKLVRHLDENKTIGLIVPMTVDRNYKIRENVRRFPNLWNIFCESFFLHRLFKKSTFFHGRAIPTSKYSTLYEVESVSGCFMIVRRSAMNNVGLLDEDFFFYTEDVDWCKRFFDAGWKIVYLSDVKSIHLGGESSTVSPAKYQIIKEKSDLTYWKKHFPETTVSVYVLLRIFKCSVSIFTLRISQLFKKDKIKTAKAEGFQARKNFLKKGFEY